MLFQFATITQPKLSLLTNSLLFLYDSGKTLISIW